MAKSKSMSYGKATSGLRFEADTLKALAEGKTPELTKVQLDTLISEGVVTWVYREGVRVLVDKAEFEE